MNNIDTQFLQRLAELRAAAQGGAIEPGLEPTPDRAEITSVEKERLAKLEGSYDALKGVRPMTITVASVLLAALVFVIGVLASQVHDLNAKFDAIPQRLTDEFRAMRAEMAAQTSAIANSITAAHQNAPTVYVVPAPAPAPSPTPPP